MTKVIWISGARFYLATVFILLFSVSAAAQISGDGYYPGSGSDGALARDTGFSLESYGSHREILTQLVAPFLMITLILQIGLYRALWWTFADDDRNWDVGAWGTSRKKERKRIRKQSMLLALLIAGMLVPTRFFDLIGTYTTVIFGSIIYILFAAIGIAFLMVLWSGLSGGE